MGRALLVLALMSAGACGAAATPTDRERARVRRWVAADEDERAWASDDGALQALIDLALDPREPATLRTRAVTVLGEVFSASASARAALLTLACERERDAPAVAQRAAEALEPGRPHRRRSLCEERADPPPRLRPAAGAFGYLAIGFGAEDELGASSGAAFGLGLTVHLGLRYGDVGILAAAHGLAQLYAGGEGSRLFAGAGPLLLFDLRVDAGLHLALGGGFDYGVISDGGEHGAQTVEGLFPSGHLRLMAIEGDLAIGGVLHVAIPPERPALFGLAAGLIVGFTTR